MIFVLSVMHVVGGFALWVVLTSTNVRKKEGRLNHYCVL